MQRCWLYQYSRTILLPSSEEYMTSESLSSWYYLYRCWCWWCIFDSLRGCWLQDVGCRWCWWWSNHPIGAMNLGLFDAAAWRDGLFCRQCACSPLWLNSVYKRRYHICLHGIYSPLVRFTWRNLLLPQILRFVAFHWPDLLARFRSWSCLLLLG